MSRQLACGLQAFQVEGFSLDDNFQKQNGGLLANETRMRTRMDSGDETKELPMTKATIVLCSSVCVYYYYTSAKASSSLIDGKQIPRFRTPSRAELDRTVAN